MKQGKDEEKIRKQAKALNMPLPESFRNPPALRMGLEFYYDAFRKLTTCRAIGMAEGPIPWTAMNDFATRQGMNYEELDYLVTLITAMDMAYLKYRGEEMNKKTKAKPSKGRR